MSETDLATLLAFFKAMANESRLRIVGLLAERERSVQELAELLELKEPTVSHHLAALTALNRGLLDQTGAVSVRGEVHARHGGWEPKVLATFVDSSGKLTAI